MSGTTLAACALANSVVTTTLYLSTTKVFSGARFGYVNSIISPAAAGAASTVISPLLTTAMHYGKEALYTKAVAAATFITITAAGAETKTA
jgi:hypothetical protein